MALRHRPHGRFALDTLVLAPGVIGISPEDLSPDYRGFGRKDYSRSMLGRRFLILVAVLMGLTALAASFAPRQPTPREERQASTPTPAPAGSPTATTVEKSVSAINDDSVVTVRSGDLVELTVDGGDEPDSVSVLGRIDAVDPDDPGAVLAARRRAGRVPDRAARGRAPDRDAGDPRGLGALAARGLGVVAGLVAPGALAPWAGHGLRRAAQRRDHLAGSAAGRAALRIVWLGGLGAHRRHGSG